MSLVKSKQRVADHGEVFTPPWLVEAMLQLVADETQRLDARFLVPILQRKLAAARVRYAASHFDLHPFSLLGLMCLYGIELLPDNIAECRENRVRLPTQTCVTYPSCMRNNSDNSSAPLWQLDQKACSPTTIASIMLQGVHEFYQAHKEAVLVSIVTTILVALSKHMLAYPWKCVTRWLHQRPSPKARALLREIQSSPAGRAKGITIHEWNGMINYWPFRHQRDDEVELGMFYPMEGKYFHVIESTEELCAKGLLRLHSKLPNGVRTYRLMK